MRRSFDIFDDVLGLKNIVDGYFDNIASASRSGSHPRVNLYKKDDTVTVSVLAPGATNADIRIELIDNALQIAVDRKAEENSEQLIRHERKFGSFSKSIRMPFRVDPDKIDAKLKDGILTVTLEKSEDAKPRKIEIK